MSAAPGFDNSEKLNQKLWTIYSPTRLTGGAWEFTGFQHKESLGIIIYTNTVG